MTSSKRLETFAAMASKRPDDPFVHYAYAMELRSLSRLDDASAAFATILSRFPDYVPTYLMAAQLAVELGQKEQARGLAEQGVEVARKCGDSHAQSELSAFAQALS